MSKGPYFSLNLLVQLESKKGGVLVFVTIEEISSYKPGKTKVLIYGITMTGIQHRICNGVIFFAFLTLGINAMS